MCKFKKKKKKKCCMLKIDSREWCLQGLQWEASAMAVVGNGRVCAVCVLSSFSQT